MVGLLCVALRSLGISLKRVRKLQFLTYEDGIPRAYRTDPWTLGRGRPGQWGAAWRHTHVEREARAMYPVTFSRGWDGLGVGAQRRGPGCLRLIPHKYGKVTKYQEANFFLQLKINSKKATNEYSIGLLI